MIEHLAASTVVAVAAIGAAAMLRRQPARWRYWILLAAVLRFAIPTAWLTDAGKSLGHRLPVRMELFQAISPIEDLLLRREATPGPTGQRTGTAVQPRGWWLVWGGGSVLCLGFWSRRLCRRVAEVRPADAGESEVFQDAASRFGLQSVRLRIAGVDQEPGASGWLRPAVILPDGLSARLSEAELRAVIEHELAHVARHDNLTAGIAHMIAAIFWFHPLLWWMERRMLAERETACDEAVLLHGSTAGDYLLGIVKACQMAVGNAVGYAGVRGSNLEKRMEHIMSVNVKASPHRKSRAGAGVLVAMAVLAPLAAGFLKAAPQESAAEWLQDAVNKLNARNLKEAEEAFRRAYQLDPTSARALSGIAEALSAQDKKEEALQMLREEAAKAPERADVWLTLGNFAVRAGRYDEGLGAFQKSLNSLDKDSPRRGDVLLRIGETYRRMGDLPAAVTALRQAVEILPQNVAARSTLALSLDASGRRDEAREAYRMALTIDPNNGIAANNLAFLLSEQGQQDEALTLAQRAKELLPNLAEVDDTLGVIYLKKSLTQEAIEIFRELVRKKPGEGSFRQHLASALDQRADTSTAILELKTLLRSVPTPESEARILQLLPAIGK